MEARLVNLQTGESIPVNKPVFRIGRERSYVDLCIPSATVSRSHCDLLKKGDSWYLVDLNSTNQTFVNGIPLPPNQEQPLDHGDEVKIADISYRFQEVQ